MSKAIVVLTRGYNNIQSYNKLIARNHNIQRCLGDLSLDIVIFHEGNILENHQTYIKCNTPKLNIKFVDVKKEGNAFIDKSYIKRDPIVKRDVSMGYFHMCSFWFVNFWYYVKEYDYILRIDEDCIVNFNLLDAFKTLENKVACYGTWVRDDPACVKGLINFNINYFKKHNLPMKSSINQNSIDKFCSTWNSKISGPYTNLFGLNLRKLRLNEKLKNYIETVKFSDYIYIYRWGDLPLWGTVLEFLYSSNDHIKLKSMKYIHDNMRINM